MKKLLMLTLGCVCCLTLNALIASAEMDAEKGLPEGAMEETMKGLPKGSPMGEMKEPMMHKGFVESKAGVSASAIIKGTQEGSSINGEVNLLETEDGLSVTAVIFNVPNLDKHGFHIHEKGSCEDGGKAAGGHFNPKGVKHGYLPDNGIENAHAGDMGNIEIDENGQGVFAIVLPGVGLTSGETSVAGKAIILHEKEDDFGQPTGNAGSRIGCGVIKISQK